ncbi:MAG TPA: PAS domain S-box protein, partial [Caulobacteraceae bacterium]|nr:PAS domain S-box protein [Caulobacteraceae bacterium]
MRDDDSQNEALARFLAENTSDMVVESSAEGRILFASHSCERILGYGTADLRGLETASLIHPQDVDGVIEALSSRIAGGEDGSDLALTYRMRNAGGDWIWVEGRPRIKYGPGGEYLSVLDILRDVTERRQAELALAESEAQLRFLSEQSHDVVISVEPGKGVVYVSPSCRRYGWEPEELLGQAGFEIMHPEDRPHIVAIIADMYEGRENRDANREQRMRTKAGDWVWMEGAPTIIRDDAGAPVGFVSVLRDISKRKEVKAALAASEARYRLLAENASDIVTECDLSGRFTYVSSSVEAVTGFSVSEVVGRQALDFCHPDDWERVKLEIAASIESPGGQRIEHRHIRKDGRVVWMQTQPRLARDPITGKAMAVTDVMRDVTERRAAEEAMAKSQAAYRLLADHSMDVILRIGPGDVIRYVSPSCRRFGYEPDDLIGRTGFELVHPEDHDHLHKLIEDLFRTGQVDPKANREYRLRANDGRYVWMEGNPSIVRDEAGAAIEVVSVLRDVSQRKCLEAELLAAKDAAEAATVAKGEFLANMSHEIRTPLTSILGFNKLMAEEPDLGERARKYLGRVGVAAQALLATVNDILDFSKLEAGQVEIERR